MEDFTGSPPKLPKETDILAALARARQASDELAGGLNRVRGCCYPSDHAKRRMRSMVEDLAQRGAVNVANLIKRDHDLQWSQELVQVQVANTDKPAAVGFCAVQDTALFAWVHKQALIERLEAEIDREPDDRNALGPDERARREAELQAQILAQDRNEAEIVWLARERGLPAEHRRSCSPLAWRRAARRLE
jgi:hypothetical protein